MENDIKIFMVEDDPNFGAVLKSYLEINNFNIEWVKDGSIAISKFKNDEYDLCLLDIMLPGMDGFEVARQIRKISREIPLIFLTAKKLKEDILKGFQIGADDYIVKPFDSEVLIYKIKAILKRNENSAPKDKEEYMIGKYYFNYPQRTIKFEDNTQRLSPKESDLLYMLCRKMNTVLSREETLKTIWGDDNYFTTRSMDVYITKLRKFLKDDPDIEIVNIHGSGYKLNISPH